MLIEFKVKIKLPIIGKFFTILWLDEESPDVIFREQGATQYSHDLHNGTFKFEVVLDDTHEAIGDDCDMNLYSNGIITLSSKGLDFEMLLNPLKEQLDLPPVFIKEGNVFGWKIEIVRVISERTVQVWRIIYNSPDIARIFLLILLLCKNDGLVSQHIIITLQKVFPFNDFIVGMILLANDKESTGYRDLKQAGKVKVPSIKDIAGQWFVCEPIHRVDIVNIGIGDSIEYGNLSNDVHLRVYLNTRLRASKLCPAKERHTEVDGGRINSIKSAMKFKLSRNPSLLREGYHVEGKLLKDAIVSEIVSLGKRTSVDGYLPKSEMKRLLRMSGCNIREFPKSAAAYKLSKHESEQMAPVGRCPFFGSIVGIGHKPFEKPFGQKADYLREYISSYMHTCSSFDLEAKVYISKVRQGFPHLYCCA